MIHLTKGKHEIVVAYASQSGYAGVTLTWDTKEGNGFIPWNSLLPEIFILTSIVFGKTQLRFEQARHLERQESLSARAAT